MPPIIENQTTCICMHIFTLCHLRHMGKKFLWYLLGYSNTGLMLVISDCKEKIYIKI